MKAWCEQCNQFINIDHYTSLFRNGSLTIKGKPVSAQEEYTTCPICGGEIITNDMADRNIKSFHNAYRLSVGSITADEIQEILDMYDIGAQPLSLLLGWGANTIERQMKHTVPDREHANRLRSLKDPSVMRQLLLEGKDRISETAYNKAMQAVSLLCVSQNTVSSVEYCVSSDPFRSILPAVFSAVLNGRKGVFHQDYTPSPRNNTRNVFKLATSAVGGFSND